MGLSRCWRAIQGDGGYLGVNGLAVVPGSVWVANPTGMMGSMARFRRVGLVEHAPAQGGAVRSKAINVLATGGVLWISGGGGDAISCANQLTAKARDTLVDHRDGWNSLGTLAGRMYRAVGPRLARLSPARLAAADGDNSPNGS